MKQIRRWRIKLLKCEVEDIAKGIEIAGSHGPSAVQSSTIKQHTVEVLKHTHTRIHMIKIEIAYFVELNVRTSTLQKWRKSVGCALTYWCAKFKTWRKAWRKALRKTAVHEFWCIKIFNRLYINAQCFKFDDFWSIGFRLIYCII